MKLWILFLLFILSVATLVAAEESKSESASEESSSSSSSASESENDTSTSSSSSSASSSEEDENDQDSSTESDDSDDSDDSSSESDNDNEEDQNEGQFHKPASKNGIYNKSPSYCRRIFGTTYRRRRQAYLVCAVMVKNGYKMITANRCPSPGYTGCNCQRVQRYIQRPAGVSHPRLNYTYRYTIPRRDQPCGRHRSIVNKWYWLWWLFNCFPNRC